MESQIVNVHYLPRYVAAEELAGSVVVVIDVLRATTTICQALASGATEVVPFLEIDETLAAAERVGRANVVLGGERKGVKIPGFDLGNSPSDYTPEAVGGRPVYITTTNGTRALVHARQARRVLVGAIVNLSAIAASIKDEPRIDILCAGTDGSETGEDRMAAGGIVQAIMEKTSAESKLNKNAAAAQNEWQEGVSIATRSGITLSKWLAEELRETSGGRNLLGIGLDSDLIDCAQLDRLKVVPEFVVESWRIRPV